MIQKHLKSKVLILLLLSLSMLLGACSNDANTPVPVTSAAVPTATTKPVQSVSSGPGSELVGQMVAIGDLDIHILSVRRFTELGTVKPKGVFLEVVYEIANVGKMHANNDVVKLVDDKGRDVSSDISMDARVALATMNLQEKREYKISTAVNPGFVYADQVVYDLPADATSVSLAPKKGYIINDSRKPTAKSFQPTNSTDSGASQELVGKTIFVTRSKLDVKIIKVERVSEVVNGTEIFKSGGAFLLIQYEAKNNNSSDTSLGTVRFDLKDNQGRVYSAAATDFDAQSAISEKYKSFATTTIAPGKTQLGYILFELGKDSAGIDIVEAP